MKSFSAVLQGGDRRSIGRSDAVIAAVKREPARFAELWDCLTDGDPLVRMRAADALEKLSRDDPSALATYKDVLLARTPDDGTAEVRWHLIAMTSRLSLDAREAKGVAAYLERCLRDDPSRIVKVAALQAAADLRSRHPELDDPFRDMLDWACSSPYPSVRARARKLAPSA
jgi:hypothetical protein